MRRHTTTQRMPREHFEADEKPHLLPAPTTPYDIPIWCEPKVGADTTALNFELPGSAPASAETAAPAARAPASSGGLDFDLNLGGSEPAGEATAAPAMDLSAISLDLGTPSEAPAAASGGDPKWQEVATKLDLAKAYEEMGDKDGARDLLNEVVKEGDAAQQEQAKTMLTALG